MVSRRTPATLLSVLALAVGACQAPGLAPTPDAGVAHELAVDFRAGAPEADKAALRARFGAARVTPLHGQTEVWTLGSAEAAAHAASTLASEPAVDFAAPNAPRRLAGFYFRSPSPTPTPAPAIMMPGAPATANAAPTPQPVVAAPVTRPINPQGDPDSDKQWYLAQSRFTDVWASSTGHGVTVAVIDSGVDPDHPDLKANLLPMIDEVAARGKRDLSYGRDYAGLDGNGHGTHVAGIIGASASNGRGIRGAAPSVKLLPIKVTTALGETDDVTIAKGIFDAVDQGAHVINLSIGGPDPSLLLLEAINYAFNRGVTVVIAAGNEAREVNYPAAFDGVIAVGALSHTAQVTSYSNRGPKLVICAPGGGKAGGWEGPAIFATTPTYPCHVTQTEGNTQAYGYLAGTSMATPMVTAAVALILANEPGLAPAQVRTRLAATATDLETPGYDERSGFGALDAKRAFDHGKRP
ncbi:MAG: S8 family serine peptidase [Candidatus Sericytochromatia bacterium]